MMQGATAPSSTMMHGQRAQCVLLPRGLLIILVLLGGQMCPPLLRAFRRTQDACEATARAPRSGRGGLACHWHSRSGGRHPPPALFRHPRARGGCPWLRLRWLRLFWRRHIRSVLINWRRQLEALLLLLQNPILREYFQRHIDPRDGALAFQVGFDGGPADQLARTAWCAPQVRNCLPHKRAGSGHGCVRGAML